MSTSPECKIFGFGTAAIDFRLKTADLGIDYRDKLLAQSVEVFGGGATANCLTQVARLGGNAFWLGKLGKDWIGDTILDQLDKERIDCSLVSRDGSLCSPFNVAVYAGEERRRIGGFLLPNSLSEITQDDIERFTSNIASGDWVLCEIGEIPLKTALMFCRSVKDREATLMIDVDLDPVVQCGGKRDLIFAILSYADILVPNRSAILSLYPNSEPSRLAGRMASDFRAVTVVTAGEEGVYYCEPDRTGSHRNAMQADVVDTVGAGDAFHGGLLYGLSAGRSLEGAIDLGIRCATLNCMSFGARTGMPKA